MLDLTTSSEGKMQHMQLPGSEYHFMHVNPYYAPLQSTADMTAMQQISSREAELHAVTNNATNWATRQAFDTQQMKDLHGILKLMTIDAGRYYIASSEIFMGSEIDRGSFGIICHATYKGTPVAVKKLGEDKAGSGVRQIIRNAFLELLVLQGLRHPNIVIFKGLAADFHAGGGKFGLELVFELCNNGNLYTYMFQRKIAISFDNRLRIAGEVAHGMSYLHDQKILHRDLSSRNVLLTTDVTAKISDFGLSRKFTGDSYVSTTISGSPPYMSPEQLSGKALTLKADVWSMGVLLWELICVEVPWKEEGRNLSDPDLLYKLIVTEGKRLRIPFSNRYPLGHQYKEFADLFSRIFEINAAVRPSMVQVAMILHSHTQSNKSSVQTPLRRNSDPESKNNQFASASRTPDTLSVQNSRPAIRTNHSISRSFSEYSGGSLMAKERIVPVVSEQRPTRDTGDNRSLAYGEISDYDAVYRNSQKMLANTNTATQNSTHKNEWYAQSPSRLEEMAHDNEDHFFCDIPDSNDFHAATFDDPPILRPIAPSKASGSHRIREGQWLAEWQKQLNFKGDSSPFSGLWQKAEAATSKIYNTTKPRKSEQQQHMDGTDMRKHFSNDAPFKYEDPASRNDGSLHQLNSESDGLLQGQPYLSGHDYGLPVQVSNGLPPYGQENINISKTKKPLGDSPNNAHRNMPRLFDFDEESEQTSPNGENTQQDTSELSMTDWGLETRNLFANFTGACHDIAEKAKNSAVQALGNLSKASDCGSVSVASPTTSAITLR